MSDAGLGGESEKVEIHELVYCCGRRIGPKGVALWSHSRLHQHGVVVRFVAAGLKDDPGTPEQ